MIKNIVFDMGNVLIKFDRDIFLDKIEAFGEDREILMREVYLSLEWSMMDRGSLTDEQAAERMRRRVPERLHKYVNALTFEWERPILPIDGMEELVRELKAKGYHIFLLSNASLRQHDYWPLVPAAECFEDTVISADVKLVKPQPEIYLYAMYKFGARPEESVFIDDTGPNVEGAVYSGLHGIVFHGSTEELREKLRELGVDC